MSWTIKLGGLNTKSFNSDTNINELYLYPVLPETPVDPYVLGEGSFKVNGFDISMLMNSGQQLYQMTCDNEFNIGDLLTITGNAGVNIYWDGDVQTYLLNTSFYVVGKTFFNPGYVYKIGILDTSIPIIDLHCLEFKPQLADESIEYRYWTGGYRKIVKNRLKFDIEIFPFQTDGNFSTIDGQETYWKLQKILSYLYIYILSVDSKFTRIPLLKDYFSLPIEVSLFDIGELESNKDQNQNRLSFSLVSKNRFTWNQ